MEIHSIRVWMGRRRPKREDAAACHIAHVLHFSYFRVDMLSSESCTATPKWRLLCVHINTRSLAKSGKERNNNINNDSSISFLLTSFFSVVSVTPNAANSMGEASIAQRDRCATAILNSFAHITKSARNRYIYNRKRKEREREKTSGACHNRLVAHYSREEWRARLRKLVFHESRTGD